MRITSKGQVTIPQAVRESAGLLPNTEVDIVVMDGTSRSARHEQPSIVARATRVRHLRGSGRGVG